MMDKKERTNERTPLFHDSKETERIDDDLDIGTAMACSYLFSYS
jgi:hypothetical protein